MTDELHFTMGFEPQTIEHLGLNLYGTLPPVIAELISNAWDADAKHVEISIPTGVITKDSMVVVKDYGSGMNKSELQDAYLKIGRNRRADTGKTHTNAGRKLMGRKGLGKLSAFGIAEEIQVRTVQNGFAIAIALNFDRMLAWPKGTDYEPTVLTALSGDTTDPNGTEICIKKLKRSTPIPIDQYRRQLARRFTIVGDKFRVIINGSELSLADRRLREDCKIAWDVSEVPDGNRVNTDPDWTVTGWMGLIPKSSQVDRGVDIFASGKIVEMDSMFNYGGTTAQFARAYVVGEIHAEFLDDYVDYISTARNSVRWESDAGAILQEWGQKALKFLLNQWVEMQHREKEEKIITIGGFDTWLKTREVREQKVARKLVKVIVDDNDIEPESAGPLLEIIKTNIEFAAFQDLVSDIENSGSPVNIKKLLELIKEWRIFEARELLRLSDGRNEVIKQLSKYIREGALEVAEMQPLFEENGWLVNAEWINVTGQNRYSELLRENCPEPTDLDDKDRRLDILGYNPGGSLCIVELKHPKKTVSRRDLEQIERYTDWGRTHLMGATHGSNIKYIEGILIVGNYSANAEIQKKQERLDGSGIRVMTYNDLLTRAEKIYNEIEDRLKQIAPEYSAQRRKTMT